MFAISLGIGAQITIQSTGPRALGLRNEIRHRMRCGATSIFGMQSNVPLVPLVAALALGAGGGYTLSRFTSHPSAPVAVLTGSPRETTAPASGTSPKGNAPDLRRGAPGTLVPVPFADMDRELSLLKTLEWSVRQERLGDLARAAELDNPAGVLALAEAKLSAVDAEQFRAVVVGQWAQVDPAAAVAWAQKQTPVTRDALLSAAVRAWVKRDGAGALEFVAKIKEPALHGILEHAAFSGLADADPDRAWALLEKMPESGNRPELVQTVLIAMVRQDAGRAARLAMGYWGKDRYASLAQEVVNRWLDQDPRNAAEWLRTQPVGPARNILIVGLAGELSRRLPETAMVLVRSLPAGPLREQSLQAAFSQWVRNDFEGAIRWAEAAHEPALVRTAKFASVEYLAGVDPRRAAALLREIPDAVAGEQKEERLGQIARLWAQRDLGEAMAWAKTLPARQQLSAIPGILAEQAIVNPQAALAQAEALTDSRLHRQAIQSVVAEWSGREAGAAAKWLLEQPDRRLMAEMAPNILQQLAESDHETALELIQQIPPGDARTRALTGLLAGMANTNLPGAVEMLDQMPAGTAKDSAMEQLAWAWGRQDPEAAAKYALKQPDTDGRTRLLDAVATEWAQRDPVAGAAFWKELGPGAGRDVFADNLARHWAESDPQAAVRWVASLTGADQRPELVANVIGAWAQQSPAEAAAYAGQLPAEMQEGALRSVLGAYAEQDPATGAKWLAAFPDAAMRDRATVDFINRWAQGDAAAAGEWLRSQPAGPGQQSAIEEFARAVTPREPASAWEWAGAVANEQSRMELQKQAMDRWMRVDPDAAGRALTQSDWPEDLKEEIRRHR